MRKIMNKKGQKGNMGAGTVVIGIAAIAVVAILVFMVMQNNTQTSDRIIKGLTGDTCDSTTTPSLTINTVDQDGASVTETANAWRYDDSKTWNNFTAGTAFDVSAEKTIVVVIGTTSTTFTDNAYGPSFSYDVPCEENPTHEVEVTNDEIEGSVSGTFLDAVGAAAGEDFSAGQTQTISILLSTGTDEVFGNPFLGSDTPNVMCLELNTTAWDVPEKVWIDGGSDLKSTSTPLRHTATAGSIDYCYELPILTDSSVEINLRLNADDTEAASVDDTASFYAANWYIYKGELLSGVENGDGTAVGTDAAATVTLDFTA